MKKIFEEKAAAVQKLFDNLGASNAVPEDEKVPDDILEERFSALVEFDSLLLGVEDPVGGILEALGALKLAAGNLADGLQQLPCEGQGHPCSGLLAQLLGYLSACSQQLGSGEACLQAVQELTRQAREQNTEAQRICATRRQAWAESQRCNEGVDEIRKRFGGRPVSLDEKSARLKAKREADELFEERTKEARQVLDEWKERKWARVQPILAELCSCCTSVFGGMQVQGRGSGSGAPAGAVAPAPTPAGVGSSDGMDPSDPESAKPCTSAPGGTDPSDGPSPPVIQPGLASWSPQKRESVEVWSSSQGAWLPALVEEVFEAPGMDGGFRVPAGTLKVSSSAGVKFVRAEDVGATLRPPEA